MTARTLRPWYAAAILLGALYGCATPPPEQRSGDTGATAAVDDAPTVADLTPRPGPGEHHHLEHEQPAGVDAWDQLPDEHLIALGALHHSTTTSTAPPPPPPTTVPAPATPPPASPPAPPTPGPVGDTIWDRLAQCESGGNWQINTGNGHYGGLQFTLQSWRGVGGTGYPHEHPRAEQIHRAERLLAIQGWGAWPGCSRRLGLR